jgi:hypothetical protein
VGLEVRVGVDERNLAKDILRHMLSRDDQQAAGLDMRGHGDDDDGSKKTDDDQDYDLVTLVLPDVDLDLS